MQNVGLRTGQVLSDEQLRQAAPSIFTEQPHPEMSQRYSLMRTSAVVDGMRGAGFMPFYARQSEARSPGGLMYARHEVRFRHVDTITKLKGMHTPGLFLKEPEEFNEISLINAHDGTSQYVMMHGVFRLLCFNGLIVSSGSASEVRIRHSGDILHNVIEGATRIVEDTENIVMLREGMKALTLEAPEQTAFAEAALQLRYGDDSPISPDALLRAHREQDTVPTLWNVFNVVQENMIKGGVRGRTVATGRRMTTRGITGITQDIAINRMLWNLAEAARNMKESLGDVMSLDEAEVLEG